jgi:serine/threonine protein kinase
MQEVALPDSHRLLEYQILRCIGRGGFGLTYLARDSHLDLPVAIKEYFPAELAERSVDLQVMPRSDGDSKQMFEWGLERFLDEARALASFRHPNIVRVVRYFKSGGTAYIVMDYESGNPLKRWVQARGKVDEASLLGVIHPILDGLESVHATGFLHRDIKPDNIYIRGDGSPVLLDFGSARRLDLNRDLTNIVSPSYAPFEQYHSKGNQGAWSDLYSLGAVMYWMVTGNRPMESASRVKDDPMPPAVQAERASEFSHALLAVIDWALTPDEKLRPQSAAEFRAALRAATSTKELTHRLDAREIAAAELGGSALRGPVSSSLNVLRSAGALGAASTTKPGSKRNLVCTILFVDLVGYSKRSVNDQVAVKRIFNDLVADSVKGIDHANLIAIDTGDGAAVCFLGDPEEALNTARLLRDLLVRRYGDRVAARIGLHMGPVGVITDINQRVNVVGDGINVAQRIMDFAQSNQILVSRAYFEVISRIADGTSDLFSYLGQFHDKHRRAHEVYAVATGPFQVASGATAVHLPETTRTISVEALHDIETDLAQFVGPLASVLVRKAQDKVDDPTALREILMLSIPDEQDRASFLAGHHSRSRPSSPTADRSASQRTSRPTVSQRPESATRLATAPGSTTGLVNGGALALTEAQSKSVTVLLGKYVGPMAGMLLRKEMARATSSAQLFDALCAPIADPVERKQLKDALTQLFERG